jgi:hypothetical protein
MTITLATPALLFSAISLLLLAFTNRFLAIARLIRELHGKYLSEGDKGVVIGQIRNLRLRLNLIRNMQFFGVFSFFLCVLSMIFIFGSNDRWGSYFFGASLILLLISLAISLREVQLSTKALELELSDMELGSNPKF